MTMTNEHQGAVTGYEWFVTCPACGTQTELRWSDDLNEGVTCDGDWHIKGCGRTLRATVEITEGDDDDE